MNDQQLLQEIGKEEKQITIDCAVHTIPDGFGYFKAIVPTFKGISAPIDTVFSRNVGSQYFLATLDASETVPLHHFCHSLLSRAL